MRYVRRRKEGWLRFLFSKRKRCAWAIGSICQWRFPFCSLSCIAAHTFESLNSCSIVFRSFGSDSVHFLRRSYFLKSHSSSVKLKFFGSKYRVSSSVCGKRKSGAEKEKNKRRGFSFCGFTYQLRRKSHPPELLKSETQGNVLQSWW